MYRLLGVVLLIGAGHCALADDPVRTITVNGTGFAEVEPDRATLEMSIVAREPTVAAAQKEAADVVGKVLKMTDRLDIPRNRVDTTGASVRPDYRWNRDREEHVLHGYIAERRIAVRVDALDKLGALVEGAVNAGVNQVSPPQLDSSQRKATYRDALRAAAEDARANAQQLATTLGTGLGNVMSITSGSDAPPPPVARTMNIRSMAAESDAAASYNPADLSFRAHVTVVFELTE